MFIIIFLKFPLFWSHLNVFEFAYFSDLRQTLKDFSEDSRKTFGKSYNAFFARRLPTGSLPKSPGSLLSIMIQILDMYFVCVYILDSKSYRFNLIWLFYLLFKHKSSIFEVFSVLKAFECFWICRFFQIWITLWKTSQETLGRLSEDFLGNLLWHFMLEDFPRSLEEVFCLKWYKFWICILYVLYIRV